MAATGSVATRRWRVELRATCSGTTAIRVIHAESCDNLSPLGNVPAVVVYQAYQRAQNALERVHPAATWRQLASCKTLAICTLSREAAARGPYAGAGRRACFIVFLVHYNSSLPLGAAAEALRAL